LAILRYNILMQLQNVILVMGPPGSGKGTQSKLLMQKLGYAYFSMGETLREYAKMDTDFGREIKTTIDQGFIVKDEAAKRVFEESFEKIKDIPGLIIEGYPRTPKQIEVLNNALQKSKITNVKVLFLDVDKDKLIQRLLLRSKTEGRVDDASIASIEKRFDEYGKKTATAKAYFESRGELVRINGDQEVEKVHEEIMSKL